MRKIFVRAIASLYRRRAQQRGIQDARAGCVSVTQRFDSALRLNLHFHTLWPDGVFTCPHCSGKRNADREFGILEACTLVGLSL